MNIRTRNAAALSWAGALAFFLFALPAFAAPSFPALSGRVVDEAQVLSPQAEAALTAKLEALEASTKHQLVVVTLKDLQGYDIADYGYQLGRAWGIGQKGVNDGVLLIVAPGERKVRIEVGYGLEPILTDALSNVILQRAVLPKFKAGDMEGGIVAGADEIITQLSVDATTAQKNVQAAAAQPGETGGAIPIWVIVFIAFWIFSSIFRRRRGGRAGDWLIPWIIFSSGAGRGGGWYGGGRGGGGGGFSGGGGSFGGGGSSGSW